MKTTRLVNCVSTDLSRLIDYNIVSRLNSDTTQIQDNMTIHVNMLMKCSLSVVAIIVILFIQNWILAFTALVAYVPICVFQIWFNKKMISLGYEVQRERAEMSKIAEETIVHIRTVKSFANEEDEHAKFCKYS